MSVMWKLERPQAASIRGQEQGGISHGRVHITLLPGAKAPRGVKSLPCMTRISPWAWYGLLLLAMGQRCGTMGSCFPAIFRFSCPGNFTGWNFLPSSWRWPGLARGSGIATGRAPARLALALFRIAVLAFYIVLQTRIDYYAQHLFFAHRWAHFVLHHAGAFLIAMGMSGPVLFAGMPVFLKPLVAAAAGARLRECAPTSGGRAGAVCRVCSISG